MYHYYYILPSSLCRETERLHMLGCLRLLYTQSNSNSGCLCATVAYINTKHITHCSAFTFSKQKTDRESTVFRFLRCSLTTIIYYYYHRLMIPVRYYVVIVDGDVLCQSVRYSYFDTQTFFSFFLFSLTLVCLCAPLRLGSRASVALHCLSTHFYFENIVSVFISFEWL